MRIVLNSQRLSLLLILVILVSGCAREFYVANIDTYLNQESNMIVIDGFKISNTYERTYYECLEEVNTVITKTFSFQTTCTYGIVGSVTLALHEYTNAKNESYFVYVSQIKRNPDDQMIETGKDFLSLLNTNTNTFKNIDFITIYKSTIINQPSGRDTLMIPITEKFIQFPTNDYRFDIDFKKTDVYESNGNKYKLRSNLCKNRNRLKICSDEEVDYIFFFEIEGSGLLLTKVINYANNDIAGDKPLAIDFSEIFKKDDDGKYPKIQLIKIEP